MSRPRSSPSPESIQSQDLTNERQRSFLDADLLSCLYAGSRSSRDHARWLFSLLQSYPGDVFRKAKRERVFQGRMERFQAGQQVALAYWTIRNREGLTKPDRGRSSSSLHASLARLCE